MNEKHVLAIDERKKELIKSSSTIFQLFDKPSKGLEWIQLIVLKVPMMFPKGLRNVPKEKKVKTEG